MGPGHARPQLCRARAPGHLPACCWCLHRFSGCQPRSLRGHWLCLLCYGREGRSGLAGGRGRLEPFDTWCPQYWTPWATMPRCALLVENGMKDTMLCETWSSNGPTVQGCAPRKSPPGSYCPSALTTLRLPVVALRMSIFLPWPGDLLHLTSPLRRHSDRKPLPRQLS